MKRMMVWVALVVLAGGARADVPVTDAGIPLDVPWKIAVHEFAVEKVRHPSWGLAHSERNYHSALALARCEGWTVDADALFAAAFLHDVGGLPGFEVAGVDHAVRSVQIAEPLLASWGFPMEKWPLVRETILGHTYYGAAPESRTALVFRDADILDFLGAIGIARLVAATSELGKDPTLATPFALSDRFANELPAKLTTRAARAAAPGRLAEMRLFGSAVRRYTHDGGAF